MADKIARTANAQRVSRHRIALRAAGLRPKQIWVTDTKAANFSNEAKRQSALVVSADRADSSLAAFLDEALDDIYADGL